jgi:peptide/nickel transport system substrate-binding protein
MYSRLRSRLRSAISRTALIVVVVVIIVIIAAGGFYALTQIKTTTTATSSSTTSTTSATGSSSSSTQTSSFGPANKSELIDDSSGAGTGAPDTLDPAGGDYGISDDMVYANVYQELVTFEGANSTTGVVAPSLAQNYTVNDNENYTFNLRSGVTFYPNDHQLNASTVWFSFVRGNYLNTAIETSNFLHVTEAASVITTTGMALPWGLLNAVQNATGLPVTTNYKLASTVLNQILSNFNVNNQTIKEIMSYPHQAYVVTGPLTFVANELQPYPYFLTNIAQWWGAIVDPAFVDANGGVQNNTANSYFALNGGPGTGPYYISSVQTGYSTIVLRANPTYWGLSASNIVTVLEPPKIPVIILNYGLSSNSMTEGFGTNEAQISFAGLPQLGTVWSEYSYKQYTTGLNSLIDNFGTGPNTFFLPMNVAEYPTNNTDFRLAIEHAINYTELLDNTYGYNGTVYGQNFLGPLTQQWEQYYNPDNLSMYSYNITLAASLINEAGIQEHFSVTLANGTTVGDKSAAALGSVIMDYITPNSNFEETMESIITENLAQIGVTINTQGVTAAVLGTWTTPAQWPSMVMGIGWGPDWNDPILQELDEVVTPEIYFTWMNLTSVNDALTNATFNNNQAQVTSDIAQIYNATYNYAPDIWLPNYDNYLLVQPYVAGMVYSPYTTIFGQFWYNTLYYT